MFLDVTRARNPELVEFAVALHQRGSIPPNTYVLDADSVAANASVTADAGSSHGLSMNVMTKQFGRNPRVSQLVRDAGLPQFVAVDTDEARVLWDAGLDVAHVGHLVGLSRYDVDEVVRRRPRLITVFNVDQARWIDQAASSAGVTQGLLLRMYDPSMSYHPCQHGGVTLGQLGAVLDELDGLRHVCPAGVTTHPCLDYSYDTGLGGPDPKLDLLAAAGGQLRLRYDRPIEINAPGVTCVATIGLLTAAGVTTGEPGSSLTGSTPLHAFSDQPEVPAVVYVSEVAHRHEGRVFTYGGGFYARGRVKHALVRSGRGPSGVSRCLRAVEHPPTAIDYYGELADDGPDPVRVGDTAVYAFRNQIFVTRSRVVVVEGLRTGRPLVTGHYDGRGRRVSGGG
jgi:predicted amino acid racemase